MMSDSIQNHQEMNDGGWLVAMKIGIFLAKNIYTSNLSYPKINIQINIVLPKI